MSNANTIVNRVNKRIGKVEPKRDLNMRSLLSRSRYIQLIHIGKAALKLDDETYRSVLMGCTKKTSCKELGPLELDKVLQRMKVMGFKPVNKRQPSNKFSPQSRNKKKKSQLDKLRQVWIEMSRAGHLKDGSEQGLLNWSKAQAKRWNKNVEIEGLEWLQPWMLNHLIEQLKQWQQRCEDKS